jgi:hypothetical protein
MPTISNPYASPFAAPLSNLAKAFMGGPTEAQNIYTAERALRAQRERQGIDDLSAHALTMGTPGYDPRQGVAAAFQGGVDPSRVGAGNRVHSALTYGAADPRTDNAAVAAGGSFNSTADAFRQTKAQDLQKHTASLNENARQFDQMPLAIDTPQGPVFSTRQAAVGQPAPEGLDKVKGSVARNAINQPGGLSNLGQTEQRFIGAESKSTPTPRNWQTRTGQIMTTYDGVTSAKDGSPLPDGAMVGVQATPEQAGLSGNSAVDRQLLDSRVAAQTAGAMIDRLTASLSQPNAAQSTGYLGILARGFNDLRSQAEATISLMGGEKADQAFASPDAQAALNGATQSIFSNPGINSRAQQLGIDASIIRSQVQDLAYMIAKAQDPGGRVSVDDIRRAAETVGASIMDPSAAIQVLGDLKQRVMSAQTIRESVTRQMYPTLRSGGQAPAAPAAPGAQSPPPPAPGAPQVERWVPGPDGQPTRVQ